MTKAGKERAKRIRAERTARIRALPLDYIAARFGVTVERVREQLRANAQDLRDLAARAEARGRKVNGLTAEQWSAMAAQVAARAEE